MNNQNPKPENVSYSRPRSPVFDRKRLAVYNLQLEFIRWVTPLIEGALKAELGGPREVCDQLDRASISCVLNTAEGNGKRQRQIRAKFFDDARGSATECAGCLDLLVAKGVVGADRVLDGKAILLQIVCMMSGLVERFDESGLRLREEPVQYQIGSQYTGESRERQRKRRRKN